MWVLVPVSGVRMVLVGSPGRVQFGVLGSGHEFWVDPNMFQHWLEGKQSGIRTGTASSGLWVRTM